MRTRCMLILNRETCKKTQRFKAVLVKISNALHLKLVLLNSKTFNQCDAEDTIHNHRVIHFVCQLQWLVHLQIHQCLKRKPC